MFIFSRQKKILTVILVAFGAPLTSELTHYGVDKIAKSEGAKVEAKFIQNINSLQVNTINYLKAVNNRSTEIGKTLDRHEIQIE